MSIYDALDAWQHDRISTSQALGWTGCKDEIDLQALSVVCDVDVRKPVAPQDAERVQQRVDHFSDR